MTGVGGELSKCWTAIESSGAPLLTGLRLVEREPDPPTAAMLLVELFVRHDDCDSAEVSRLLERVARKLASFPANTRDSLTDRLSAIESRSAAWMRALLLQSAGAHEQAARLLERVGPLRDYDAEALRQLSLARNLLRVGEASKAVVALRGAAQRARSFRTVSACAQVIDKLSLVDGHDVRGRRVRIALLGSTTLDLGASALRVACYGAGIDATVHTGGYGQYRQEIMVGDSNLSKFSPEVIILACDGREFGLEEEVPDPEGFIEARVSELRALWRECRERLGAFVVQHDFEIPAADPLGRMSAVLAGGPARVVSRLNLALQQAASEQEGVAVLGVDHVAGLYGKLAWSQSSFWYSAQQHPAPDALSHLAAHQVALLRSVLGLSLKCVVLDLDNTLWGGVVGEDGLSGIRLGGTGEGAAFVAFQRYLKALRARGVVLAVCSKNNEEEARLPFEEHPEMVLRADDISAFVANWSPKDENVRAIARSLNLGLDSLVFVDDNPAEREWIRQRLPEVEVPDLPEDPADYVRALDSHRYFEAHCLTTEDRARPASYREEAQRRELQAGSESVEAFLRGLRMQVNIGPFEDVDLARIAQLVNKTNQFNLTTRRRSEAQIQVLMNDRSVVTIALRVRDRFGDSGLTGALIAVVDGTNVRVDTWLMSCRILGRRLEEVMLCALERTARTRGAQLLIGEYLPTAKNGQVGDLFQRLGFELALNEPGGRRVSHRALHGERPDWPTWAQVLEARP